MKRLRFLRFIVIAAFALAASRVRADEALVSAAASLTDSMNEIGKTYSAVHRGTTVRFNFGSSGALKQQIEQGAPVDVFVSASPVEMDGLAKANKIVAATRADIAGNILVLIAPPGSRVRHWSDLAKADAARIAISNPDSVPSGRYARETLQHRNLWSAVQPKAILGENVRQTLAYVTGRNVDAGTVFETDAKIEAGRVRIVDRAIPGTDHAPIIYSAAVVSGAPNATAARTFVQFLKDAAAQRILQKFGFSPRPGNPGGLHLEQGGKLPLISFGRVTLGGKVSAQCRK